MYRIMVVDDNEVVRKKIKRLKIWGEDTGFYITDEAVNGYEALQKLKVQPVDLVITDIRMPKIDGIELLKKINEKVLVPYVVLLSEYSEFSYAKDGFKYGAFDYLVKPVQEAELRFVIGKVKKQLLSRQTEIEKIKALELKLSENVVFYPVDQVKDIIDNLGGGELKIVNAVEKLVNLTTTVLNNDRLKIASILQSIMQEIWEASSDKYSWLEMFVNRASINIYLLNVIDVDSMKTVFWDGIKRLNANIEMFEPNNDNDNTIKQICQFVLENVSNEITLDMISKETYFNKSYISNLFKQKTNMTINEYIKLVKMERAKRLLEEDNQTNSEVAYKLGYSDVNYFIKLFKKYTGLPPAAYRKQICNNHLGNYL